MKRRSGRRAAKAFTFVELIIVIAIIAVMALLLIPALKRTNGTSSWVTRCMSNLRQIGLGLYMFADDNHNRYPPQVSVADGGSLELIASNSAALHFRTLSNHLHGNWSIWHCPADRARQPLTNSTALTDTNLSYFISLDATLALTNAILSGDRNLEVAGQPVNAGLFTLTTNTAVGWTSELHKSKAGGCGNLLFVDTRVQNVRAALPAIQRQGLATNRLVIP